jgi:hypothetical protein
MKNFKTIIVITTVFFAFNSSAQKISDKNSTYRNVNYDQLYKKLDWSIDPIRMIGFNTGEVENPNASVGLKIEKSVSKIFSKKELFQLDTINHSHGYFKFYANPAYFDSLERIDISGSKKGCYYLSKLTNEISLDDKSLYELSGILIETGVIVTYSHLNAEMIDKVVENTTDKYVLKYNAVWHYCTNDCYHPKYKFTLTVYKETRRIWLEKM